MIGVATRVFPWPPFAGANTRYDSDEGQHMASEFSSEGRSKRLLTSKEAARYLGISERHLWAITAAGAPPCIKVGRSVRYAIDDLDGYIDSRRMGRRGA